MRNEKRKFISTALVVSMMFFIFLGNSILANAAGNVIESVKITSVPQLEVGASIADAVATVEIPEGCVAESYWKVWDAAAEEGTGAYIKVTDGNFDANGVYRFGIIFKTTEGYQFDAEGWLDVKLADGVSEGEMYGEGEGNDLVYCWELPVVSAATKIDKIEVKYPAAVVGNLATVDEVKIYSGSTLVANDNFDINTYWECMSDNYVDVTGQAFEDGKVYQVHVNVTPKAGYYFSESMVADMNGKEESPFATPSKIELFADYSFEAPLTKAEITGLPEEKAGEVMVDTVGLVIDVENYESFIYWYDENDEEVTGKKMEAGKIYTAVIEINGYGYSAISEDFVFVVDGKEYKPSELLLESNQAYLTLKYEPGLVTSDDSTGSVEEDTDPNTEPEIIVDEESETVDVAVKTGDTSMIVLWVAAFILGIAGIVVNSRKRM